MSSKKRSKIEDFKLERYFAKYEFDSTYLLCSSDCESFSVKELMQLATVPTEEILELSLGYTESKGDPQLLQAIAMQYIGGKPEDVVTFAGAQEAIFILMNVFLERGDEIIVQFPCYQSLYEVAKSIGVKVKFWEMEEAKDWSLDINQLQELITDRTRLIVLNFPNNPTGSLIKKEDYFEIIEIARNKGIYILNDEVYRLLEYQVADRLPSIYEVYEKGIAISVMSKSYGLAGLRVGWVVSKDPELLLAMNKYKDYTSLCNNKLGEYLTLLALKNSQLILDRNLKIIKSNLIMLELFLKKYEGLFSYNLPKAGSIMFTKINLEKITTWDFCESLQKEKHVFLLPSEVFAYKPGFLRIGIGRRNFKECLTQLDDFVQDYVT